MTTISKVWILDLFLFLSHIHSITWLFLTLVFVPTFPKFNMLSVCMFGTNFGCSHLQFAPYTSHVMFTTLGNPCISQLESFAFACQPYRFLRSSVRWGKLGKAQRGMTTPASPLGKPQVEAATSRRRLSPPSPVQPLPPWDPADPCLRRPSPRSLRSCSAAAWPSLTRKPRLPWSTSASRSSASCTALRRALRRTVMEDWWVAWRGRWRCRRTDSGVAASVTAMPGAQTLRGGPSLVSTVCMTWMKTDFRRRFLTAAQLIHSSSVVGSSPLACKRIGPCCSR